MTETDEITREIIGQTGGAVTELYKDAIKPTAQPLGEIVGYLPRTLRVFLNGWGKWLNNREESLQLTAEAIEDKIKTIPEEKIVEPEAFVAIPAIQQLSYCQNSEVLRDLYANLLVSSMNIDTKWQVHPSYVDIVKQLNPDEAKFMKSLTPDSNLLYPLVDVEEVVEVKKRSYLMTNFTTSCFELLEHPENICSYIDNLVRLSLIEIPNRRIADNNIYKELEQHPIIQGIKQRNDQRVIQCTYKSFKLTNYGVNFVKVVCK